MKYPPICGINLANFWWDSLFIVVIFYNLKLYSVLFHFLRARTIFVSKAVSANAHFDSGQRTRFCLATLQLLIIQLEPEDLDTYVFDNTFNFHHPNWLMK